VTTVTFFDVPLAEVPASRGDYNVAFFCPLCGRIWGRLQRPKVRGWLSVTRPCNCRANEGWPHEVPGSFFQSFNWYNGTDGMMRILAANPQLARHELNVHFQHFKLRQKGLA
jgi:hypothetical protein